MNITMKQIVCGLAAVGLLAFSSTGLTRAQENLAPTASPKIIACLRNGDVACVSEFLNHGGKLNGVDEKGVPFLVIASEARSPTIVRLLLNGGADINGAGEGDETPICRAALFGRKETAQALLDAGAKANVICDADHGDSALMVAIRGAMFSGMPPELQDKIFNPEDLAERADTEAERKENVNRLRKMLATSGDDYLEIARMLLARGADVNVQAKCDVGESALWYAALASNVEMVRALLTHGADANREPQILDLLRELETECLQGKSIPVPLRSRQQAAMINRGEQTKSRHEEIVRLLKAAGATETQREESEVNRKVDPKEFARDAFDDVIKLNDLKEFERLVAAYLKHPLGTEALTDALWGAVVYARVEMVKLLLERGVNPNAPAGKPNFSPLIEAAGSANFEIVKLLLDAGADLNAQDETGRTALDHVEMYLSSSATHQTMADLLKSRGAINGKIKK